MSTRNPPPLTGHQRTFDDDQLIVTKTDLTGPIVSASDTFVIISGVSEAGSPARLSRSTRKFDAVARAAAATADISRSDQEATADTREVSRRAAEAGDGARRSEALASRVMTVAAKLSQGASSLSTDVGTFVGKIPG